MGLVMLVSLTLVLSYCGSKSSDSGNTGTASAGAGASASTGAIQTATLSLSATAGNTSAPSFSKAKNLSEAVNGLYSGLRAKRLDAIALKAKFAAAATSYKAPVTTNCSSGTMTEDIVTTLTTTTRTVTYANCVTTIGSVSQFQNGTVVFVDSGSSFSFSIGNNATPYTYKLTRISDGAVLLDDVIAVTYTGAADQGTGTTCGSPSRTEYQKFTIGIDGSMHLKGIDLIGVAYDETAVFTAFQLVATSTLDGSCTATGGTITESGTVSYTDNLDIKGTASMDISAANPLRLTWTAVTGGDTYLISGTITMATPCFTGTLTLATPTAIFIPTDGECPTAGEITVSGDVNGTVVYTSTGGVLIKDGTGTVVESYTSCNQAHACS